MVTPAPRPPPKRGSHSPMRMPFPPAGFDYSSEYYMESTTSSMLSDAKAVRSVTGEFCQRDGTYSQERPTGDAVPTNGGNCTVLTSLVCVRCARPVNGDLALCDFFWGGRSVCGGGEEGRGGREEKGRGVPGGTCKP